ncbi:helicase SNF [Cohnella sp. CFH 77786]|uniref:DEAD/DEAH box helicase n=1 Tax=Cohnella sp. CFH 77786 TaxID=2662265 RepID=UPI001C609024|nr:DEAD/DEAH box helicase [Cohnella sp. CFH 77786]MBW5446711.1 helicase SNF [Cohnella sp. CFH 77786]
MTQPVSLADIRAWCGEDIYRKGQTYFKQKRVLRLERDPDGRLFDAVVTGTKRYNVHLELYDEGEPSAACECPYYESTRTPCKHIAAVLLRIHELQGGAAQPDEAPVITNEHVFLARNMISIFDRAPAADAAEGDYLLGEQETVNFEYTCTASASQRKPTLTIEIKLGTKRLYTIQRIKQLLGHIENGTPYEIAKLFTLDPTVHSFTETDRAILDHLVDISRNETAYRESHLMYAFSGLTGNDRMLFIPPYAWERLLPLLLKANVRFVHGGQTYSDLREEHGSVPLTFRFSQPSQEVYRVAVEGLQHVTVLEPYDACLEGNRIYRMDSATCKQIAELKNMFSRTSGHQVLISPAHLELFLARVVPGLKRIGPVIFEENVQNRIVTAPLAAKLYLDRDDDRLLARLEFVYGDVSLDPLLSRTGRAERTDKILLRDGEKESRVMSLIEQIPFRYDGKSLHLDEEDDIYHFLFRTLPQLNKWTEVYATAAVESMLAAPPRPPKVMIDLDPGTDWLEVRFDMDGIDDEEIRDLLRHLVEKKKYYRMPNGAYVSLEDEGYASIGRMLEEMEFKRYELQDTRLQLSVSRGLRFLDPEDKVQGVKLGQRFREMLENMRHPDSLDFHVPETLHPILRDYQKYGFQWMKTLAHYRFGGILADDMGLGKTLQSIAFLLSELPRIREDGLPALIVCPASLTYNWWNELRKFAPDIRAVVVEGDKSARGDILGDLSGVDVLITSYPLLRRDAEEFSELRFSVLILDEAQAIKNHATQTAQTVKDLRAMHRFALTGTPIENRLEELWSIFDAVFPELFWNRKRFSELSPEQVAKKIRPFLLRRLKSDVLKELPDKIETVQASELLPDQKKLYLAYLARLQEDAIRRIREDGFQKSRMHILAGMTRLRQLCCHPAMFVEGYSGESGKLEQLLEIVEECRGAGKRMLIFSQFTEMLGIIRGELGKLGVSFFYLDGQTPGRDRVEMCRKFNEGEGELFLISLKAGGTGLNLVGADTVLLFDLWWNPAVEQQAADRAHRIGQKNVVQVIRLVTQGTIEEKMYALQQRKRDLIDAVVQPGEEALASLGEEDIRELLMI